MEIKKDKHYPLWLLMHLAWKHNRRDKFQTFREYPEFGSNDNKYNNKEECHIYVPKKFVLGYICQYVLKATIGSDGLIECEKLTREYLESKGHYVLDNLEEMQEIALDFVSKINEYLRASANGTTESAYPIGGGRIGFSGLRGGEGMSTQEYKAKMMASIAEILKAYTSDEEGTWSVSYSGGKDSTVTTAQVFRALLMLKPEQRKRKIVITTAQTNLDLTTDPTKQREIQRIKQLITLYKLPVEVVEVEAEIEQSFLYLVLGMGYCLPTGRTNRWCTERLKIVPQQRYMKELNPVLTVLGVRESESAARAESVKKHQTSKYYGDNGTFMAIVDFTLDDIWAYLAIERTPWGDAEEISQLYKDATGECGLRKRQAGKGEKVDDPCGARFGCIICPVVTIDKSAREMAKRYPWFQPYVEIRDLMLDMYKKPENRAGYMRDGRALFYGEGNFSIRARMELFDLFMQAQQDNEYLANMHGAEPQPLFTQELIDKIKERWELDAKESPWLADADEIGMFFEERPKGVRGKKGQIPGQLTWNYKYDTGA